MPPRNPLREENQPQEITKGDHIDNMSTRRYAQLELPDGRVEQVFLSAHASRLNENGQFEETDMMGVRFDHAGNPLPEDPRSTILSHSGLYIDSLERLAVCTSPLHFGRSRNILIGQDGQLLDNGEVICSKCQAMRLVSYFLVGLLAVGVILGVFSGAGWF